MVLRVSENHVALVVADDTLRSLQCCFRVEVDLHDATFAEVRVHAQDMVVVEIGHQELALGSETHAPRRVQYFVTELDVLTNATRIRRLELTNKVALSAEHLDATVSGVRNDDLTIRVTCYVPGIAELTLE